MTAVEPDVLANAADLTADDHLAVETDKNASGDGDAPAVDQDPNWVPQSIVDSDGDQR